MDINDVFTTGLNLDDALGLLYDVGIYVAGMAVYAVFVFKFYRFSVLQGHVWVGPEQV